MIKEAIILIGGSGSRFSKLNQPPKHLAKINGQYIIIHLIKFLKKYGIKKIILPLGYKKKFFYKFFKSKTNQKKFNFTLNSEDRDKKRTLIKFFDSGLTPSYVLIHI